MQTPLGRRHTKRELKKSEVDSANASGTQALKKDETKPVLRHPLKKKCTHRISLRLHHKGVLCIADVVLGREKKEREKKWITSELNKIMGHRNIG